MVADGNLFLAMPPLYRISQGGTVAYARDDAHRDELLKRLLLAEERSISVASRGSVKCLQRGRKKRL